MIGLKVLTLKPGASLSATLGLYLYLPFVPLYWYLQRRDRPVRGCTIFSDLLPYRIYIRKTIRMFYMKKGVLAEENGESRVCTLNKSMNLYFPRTQP